jgi:hypothetical protein
MRILAFVMAFAICPAAALHAEQLQKQTRNPRRTNPASACGDDSRGVPDFYYEAVLARIKVPDRQNRLIRITVSEEIELVLWTDGEKFELWTDTLDTPQKDVRKFLDDLDGSCRLPPDPAAAALIKVKWESKSLSSDQFAQIHNDFMKALTQYVAKIRERFDPLMATKMSAVYVDASYYPIVYDNAYEHAEVEPWDVPDNGVVSPMINWVHQLQKLVEDSFHRPFRRK